MTQQLQTETAEYSKEERTQLLRLAHLSIRATLEDRKLSTIPPSEHLSQKRGVFTTLHLNGHLRGCIGYVLGSTPLYEAVIETAVAAAFEDPRFVPVSQQEAASLQVEISVLSPMVSIRPEDVVVGKHGLLITHEERRGLLLPQVAMEWEWDREQFLTEACRKAGLPGYAWRHGVQLEAFTAEVFGEASPGESLLEGSIS